jgi:hypothetical protein
VWLGAEGAAGLALALSGPLRRAVAEPPRERRRAWRALLGYAREHVGELRTLRSLVEAEP